MRSQHLPPGGQPDATTRKPTLLQRYCEASEDMANIAYVAADGSSRVVYTGDGLYVVRSGENYDAIRILSSSNPSAGELNTRWSPLILIEILSHWIMTSETLRSDVTNREAVVFGLNQISDWMKSETKPSGQVKPADEVG